MKKYNEALSQETKFNVGDKVRYMLNFEQFQKHTLPKWTKTVHKIVAIAGQKYKLENGQWKRYDELQLVKDVYIPPRIGGPSREQLRKENKVQRDFKKSGLDISDIRHGPRQIKPVKRLTL